MRWYVAAAVTAALAAGCAPPDEPDSEPASQVDAAEDVETDAEREERQQVTSELVCDEFRTLMDEFEDGPTQQRVSDRLGTVRTIAPLAADDVAAVVQDGSDIGTDREAEEWIRAMLEVCENY